MRVPANAPVAFLIDRHSGYYHLHVHLTEAQTLNVLAFRGVQMNLGVAAIILFSSIATSFAGNFTPIPKNKIVQNACSFNCQNNFDVCVRLRVPPPPPPTAGTQQVGPSTPPLIVGPNCEADRNICLLACQTNPRG